MNIIQYISDSLIQQKIQTSGLEIINNEEKPQETTWRKIVEKLDYEKFTGINQGCIVNDEKMFFIGQISFNYNELKIVVDSYTALGGRFIGIIKKIRPYDKHSLAIFEPNYIASTIQRHIQRI